tara:strand:- start:723 stop:1199 length:477 start_codon:yes stop_codon:yes gene_type:complete
MKRIRLYINKIKNNYYAKIPDIIAKQMNLSNGKSIEVSIINDKNEEQIEIWDLHAEDIDSITFEISNDVHTMNMYNRIYVPEKFRFFFPDHRKEFLMITNVGNIKTHITTNGYFTKGLRQWFHLNGPIMPKDKIKMSIYDEETLQYEMKYIKYNENNN